MTSIRQRLFIWLLIGLSILWAIAGAGVYLAFKQSEIAKLDSELSKLEGTIRFLGIMSQRSRGPVRPDRLIARPSGDNSQSESNRENNNRMNQTMNEFMGDSPPHYMIWNDKGKLIKKSEEISNDHFPFPKDIESNSSRIYYNLSHQGENYRVVNFKFRPFRRSGLRPRPQGSERTVTSNLDERERNGRERDNRERTVTSGDDQNIQPQEDPPPRNSNIIGAISISAKAMDQTLNFLLIAIIAVGIFAGFLSFLLVQIALKNGLKPLEVLGINLASVNPSSLSHRFSKKDLPEELTPIADHLNQLMSRLESGFNRERQFSSDLAHELRTPIAELKMMSEVALRWPDKKDENYAEETLDIALQLQETIETLLSLNRFENGQQELKAEEVNLNSIIKEGLKKYRDQIERKKIEINLEVVDGVTIYTDPGILRTIIFNLLSNCAEYTPVDGLISIKANNNSTHQLLMISNTVDNMKYEMVPHLFERFWRADDSRSDSSHIGLGLSLTRACANALSLDLHAELNEDETQIHFIIKNKNTENLKSSCSGNEEVIS